MGNDEMVMVRMARGIGEKIVDINMTKGNLQKVSPVKLPEEVATRPDLSAEDKRELSLIINQIASGTRPVVEVIDETGKRTVIPYDKPGIDAYVHEVSGK